jgi:hypothetical protein
MEIHLHYGRQNPLDDLDRKIVERRESREKTAE